MSDYSELKKLVDRIADRYDIPDDAMGELELLMTQKLKATVEFHENNAKIMEQALAAAEKKADSRIQRINQLENRLEAVKLRLGSLSYVVDYPDEEAASTVEDLRKDAERYRWLRKPSNTWDRHFDIDALDYWIVGSREETDNSTGEYLDKSVDFFMAKEKSGG